MKTKKKKIKDFDPDFDYVGFTGIIEEVGVDYEAQRKNNVMTTSNNPMLHVTFHDDGSVTYSY
jgi:hypothetical protein